jgi:hypothetical protein
VATRRDRPGYLPGTPNWPLKFVLSEVIDRRATGRPDPNAKRRGPKPMPGQPGQPARRRPQVDGASTATAKKDP